MAICKIHYDYANAECENGSTYDYMAPVICEADVVINRHAPIKAIDIPLIGNLEYYCLQDVIAHEIGHMMGLNHFGADDQCIMNRTRLYNPFITQIDPMSSGRLATLYVQGQDETYVSVECDEIDTEPIEDCVGGEYFAGGGSGGGSGGCQCECSSNRSLSGVTDEAFFNVIRFYSDFPDQDNFNYLIELYIDNYSVFESAYDEQVIFSGDINEGGIKLETEESPENRITGGEAPIVYENYPDFNTILQIAINEFAPIINREFNCDCPESYTYMDERQINILLDLIFEVKQLPVSNELILELNKVESYLETRENNNFKTDILNYMNY